MTLFGRIEHDGESVLRELIEQRVAEDVGLEFKRKARPSHGDFEKPDKEALGQNLSALANSAGGLLIFGVQASKNTDGVDAATALEPIADIERFASQARTLVGQYLSPHHDGIRVFSCSSVEDRSRGYLVVQVERSERRPHQSKAPGDGCYWKRAGDSTFKMEHYDIEDAFRRVVAPELRVGYQLRGGTSSSSALGEERTAVVTLVMFCANAVARHAFLHVSYVSHGAPNVLPFEQSALASPFTISTPPGGEIRYDCLAETVLHPDVQYNVGTIAVPVRKTIQEPRWFVGREPLEDAEVKVSLVFGAEGARRASKLVTIPGIILGRAVGLMPHA